MTWYLIKYLFLLKFLIIVKYLAYNQINIKALKILLYQTLPFF